MHSIDDGIITPYDDEFFNWDYSVGECLDELTSLLQAKETDIEYLSDWFGLSTETASIAFYKNDLDDVDKILALHCQFATHTDVETIITQPANWLSIIRAMICMNSNLLSTPEITALFMAKKPEFRAETADAHIMYQCHFGLTNRLASYKKVVENERTKHMFEPYNHLLLDAATEYASNGSASEATLNRVNTEFAPFVCSVHEDSMAAEWFPWFRYFLAKRSKF